MIFRILRANAVGMGESVPDEDHVMRNAAAGASGEVRPQSGRRNV